MKKHFLYLMAAAASLTACSTNDVIGDAGNGGDGIVTADDQQLISIGAAINAQPVQSTRSTVGGVEGTNGNGTFHSWEGESLYLFMLQKGTLKPATEGVTNGGTTTSQNIIWNTKYTAPTHTTTTTTTEGSSEEKKVAVATGSLTRFDKVIKYYPLADTHTDANGKTVYGFDFYGYYDGGAAQATTGTQNTPSYYKSATIAADGTATCTEATATAGDSVFLAVDYEIDGSHDLLAGKAEVAETATDDWKNSHTGQDWDNIKTRAFSAYTSRRDVQPSIDFSHLLSRIQFNVIAGNEITVGYLKGQTMTTDGTPTKDTYRKAMKVTGVKIVGLPNSGKLIIASTDEKTYPSSSLLWNAKEANKTYEFSLKNTQDKVISSTNGVDLTGKYEDSKFAGDKVQIGDALMVKAGETKYTVEVTLEQWVLVNEDGKNNDPTAATNAVTTGWEKKTQTITGPISLEGIDGLTDKTFQAGTSYTVNITVYGYEKIDVNGHLVPWKEGSTIDIDIDSIDNTWTTTE